MRNEPVLTAAGGSAALVAILALLVSFGVPITAEQHAAILSVWGTVGTMLLAAWTRRKVTPQ